MRIIICMISYYTNVYNIWQYDPLFNFFIYDHPHLFQRYSIILLCALLFGVESEIKLCFSPINTITFQLPYELSVKNLDQCEQCMITEKEKETLLLKNSKTNTATTVNNNRLYKRFISNELCQWYCLQMAKLDYYMNFKYVDQKKLEQYKLDTVPNITNESRSLLMILNYFIEQLCFSSYISFALFLMFFFPYYYISLMKIFNYRLIAHLFIWIDILFLTIHFAIILHNALTLVMMISITTIYQIHVLKKINSSLRLIAIQSHSINHPIVNGIYRSSFNLSEQITLMQLLIEHNRICQYIHHSSREIFSNLLFRILMLFFPSHLLGVSALWNQLGFWYDKLLISLIIFFEDFLLFPLYFIANQSKLLHRPQRNLLSIIHGIRRPLSLKIKYDHFFERLTTEPYYGYSIANIGTITYRMIFSLMLNYFGLFIFILPKEYMLKG
ncbi:uncharacterized protein LOC124498469 [Dermatophagoides farinae]|uniref:Uncharacterized protein n=1 Tax=Dermatophagoides farinae TaxID=6954 RepID=A0A9D4NQ66_DERFA|nr:hypothetical protein HUG17_10346 [Dermatophagoides farinae]